MNNFLEVEQNGLYHGYRVRTVQWFPNLAVHPDHMEKITTSSPNPDIKIRNFLRIRPRNLFLTYFTAESNVARLVIMLGTWN